MTVLPTRREAEAMHVNSHLYFVLYPSMLVLRPEDEINDVTS
jgi:hypothetical protein